MQFPTKKCCFLLPQHLTVHCASGEVVYLKNKRQTKAAILFSADFILKIGTISLIEISLIRMSFLFLTLFQTFFIISNPHVDKENKKLSVQTLFQPKFKEVLQYICASTKHNRLGERAISEDNYTYTPQYGSKALPFTAGIYYYPSHILQT